MSVDIQKLFKTYFGKVNINHRPATPTSVGKGLINNSKHNTMKIVNLTPHPITLVNSDGSIIKSWAKSEKPARCKQETQHVETLRDGTRITRTSFSDVYDLPKEIYGIKYIVSRVVLSRCPHRTDLLVPNELYRCEKTGNILGCQSFSIN